MAGPADFATAIRDLANAFAEGGDFCGPFTDVLPVTRASISLLGDPFGVETVCATDAEAARLDELQIDLGEGPCWDAVSGAAPVLEPDIQRLPRGSWPGLAEALIGAGVRGVYAFPLRVGALSIGAVDLYADSPHSMTDRDVQRAAALAGIAATQVLRLEATRRMAGRQDWPDHPGVLSRREVHQATGMVVAQLHVSPDDALFLLRAHAFALGRTVREIALDVIGRKIVLTEPPRI